MKECLQLWKRCFDYKGFSTRQEYWVPMGYHALLAMACLGTCLAALGGTAKWLFVPGIALFVYLVAALVPFVSLTVRRLHDTGRSGWWTCLGLIAGAGTVAVMLLCAGALATAFIYRPVNIYGPPPSEISEPIYGPPPAGEDDPENVPIDIYGPPGPWEEDVDAPEDDPPMGEENIPAVIYGPPEAFRQEAQK